VFCEDPKTGKLIVKPKGPCPEGYVEKMARRAQREEILFIVPRVKIVEE